ncbi:hypothetical protein HBJ39_028600 (plasmid) [Klebsiella pneumoniae]|uniref:hypothetical protein n=1 Tax=Klebsiella pneumoniae TaxID=573 RepID=UPI001AE5C85A|nr:hypothetical protein [Klebsiella pneumoniae]QSI40032.1 hypothetical protein HBJ39_028600 [Klebsiella pneumoniae]
MATDRQHIHRYNLDLLYRYYFTVRRLDNICSGTKPVHFNGESLRIYYRSMKVRARLVLPGPLRGSGASPAFAYPSPCWRQQPYGVDVIAYGAISNKRGALSSFPMARLRNERKSMEAQLMPART